MSYSRASWEVTSYVCRETTGGAEKLTSIFLDEIAEELRFAVFDGDQGADDGEGGRVPGAGKFGKRMEVLAIDDAGEERRENGT